MPHDKNGQLLAANDKVLISGAVSLIHATEDGAGCNVTIVVDNAEGESYKPEFVMNSKGVEKCTDGPPLMGAGFGDLDIVGYGAGLAAMMSAPGNLESAGLISKILGASSSVSTLLQVLQILRDHQNDIAAIISALKAIWAAINPAPPAPAPV